MDIRITGNNFSHFGNDINIIIFVYVLMTNRDYTELIALTECVTYPKFMTLYIKPHKLDSLLIISVTTCM